MPTTLSSPRISVVIPARNAAEDLPHALKTVVSQGVDDLEILIADDGSTDATETILSDAKRKDPRILHLRTGGIGPAAARNAAIEKARAPLIAFLDADDRWLPGKLIRQIVFHDAVPSATFSCTDYRHRGPEGDDLGPCFAYWPRWARLPWTDGAFAVLPDAAALVAAENAVGTATVVARKDALLASGGFDPSLKSASDWEMWIRLALDGPVGYSTGIDMDYRMIPGSVTSNRALRIACMERIIERHGPKLWAKFGDDPVRAARARIDVARAEMARGDGRPSKALSHHLGAFIKDPNSRVLRAAIADLKALAVG